MFNRGLLYKNYLEMRRITILFGIGFFLIEFLLNKIIPNIAEKLPNAFNLPVTKFMLKLLLGTEVSDQGGAAIIQSILWVHPIILFLLWGYKLVTCTRLPANELDKGSIYFLLSWPVSRSKIWLSETFIWLLCSIFVFGMGIAGHLVGRLTMKPELHIPLATLAIVIVNFFSLYLAVGGTIYFFTAISKQRSHALAMSFTLMISSFLVNFLAQHWEFAKKIDFFSFLTYYRPYFILMDGKWPMADLIVLWTIAIVCWSWGWFFFTRRDLNPN